MITGSTDGIGRAFAFELANRGFNIVLISRNQDKLNAVASEIQSKHKVQTRTVAFDFSKDTSVAGYESIMNKIADLDVSILINNVGILSYAKDFASSDP